MDIDWVLAITVFLFFVIWSFAFYISIFQFDNGYMEVAGDISRNVVMNSLNIDSFSVPVIYDSGSDTNNSVLNSGFVWYEGNQSSTRVWRGNQSLQCRLIGNDTYWLTNLTSGENYFRIEFADSETAGCNDVFSVAGSIQTSPGVLERKEMFSQSSINSMNSTPYSEYKYLLGLEGDFRVEIEGTGPLVYGKTPPTVADVFAQTFVRTIFETGEEVNVTFIVW